MIAYVMVGTNDLESAVKFYDRLMPKMNMVRVETDKDFAAYAPKSKPENIEFYVTKPFDGNRANSGNGTMIALAVETSQIVDDCHKAGIDAGGKDEGAPGFRPAHGEIYYAYVRDLDGNKLCFVHEKEF
ncbi:MAG: VOC family protein [Rhodobacteraceae bacterium]|nr:VOC family protein [Paracoccaceae bacterium]